MLTIVIGGAMFLGGIALVIVGAVLVVRSNREPLEPHYSETVTNSDAAHDGTGLPLDYQDRPQWAHTDLGADEVGPPIDSKAVDAALRIQHRKRGFMTTAAGLLLAVVGLVMLLFALTHVL